MNSIIRNIKTRLSIYGPATVLILAGFVVAFQFIQPAPPDTVRIATGDPLGAYHGFAKQYQQYFQAQGINLVLVNTAGSRENLQLLEQGKIDIAFVQGGVQSTLETNNIVAIGSMYFEPLWLFHQKTLRIQRFADLDNLRVAIGPAASGTQALVRHFLAENGIKLQAKINTTLEPSQAAKQLLAGKIDAAFFVSGPKSKLIQTLFAADTIDITSMDRAKAYAQRDRFLHELLLPEGAIDLQRNIPQQDTQLIATTANLLANGDLHPAIVTLVLQAASKMHSSGGWFERRDEFPSPAYQEFPLHEDAKRYFEYGAPFLQRYLPFWAASLIDRIKVMLLPLVVLLLPLFKIMPPLYQWRMNRKVYRWYDELETLDQQLNSDKGTEHPALLAQLKALDDDVREIKVPASFSSKLYQLRLHIDMVEKKIRPH